MNRTAKEAFSGVIGGAAFAAAVGIVGKIEAGGSLALAWLALAALAIMAGAVYALEK